jgi:hypothetical protein
VPKLVALITRGWVDNQAIHARKAHPCTLLGGVQTVAREQDAGLDQFLIEIAAAGSASDRLRMPWWL